LAKRKIVGFWTLPCIIFGIKRRIGIEPWTLLPLAAELEW
jgi:hypothetical protein